MIGNLLWNIIELIDARWLWRKAYWYYHKKKVDNDVQSMIAFHPNQMQMRCVYNARIDACLEKLKGET